MWFWVPFAILLRSWLIFQPSSENMKGQHVDDVVIMSSNWVERRRQSRGQQSGWPYSAAFADLFVKKKIMKAGASSENMKGQHVDEFFFVDICQFRSIYLTCDPITWSDQWPDRFSKLWYTYCVWQQEELGNCLERVCACVFGVELSRVRGAQLSTKPQSKREAFLYSFVAWGKRFLWPAKS